MIHALSLILIFSVTIKAQKTNLNENILIEKINIMPNVLDEWKYPGRYSPFMAFDGKKNTSFSEGGEDSDYFDLFITLNNKISFDEIRIAHGLFYNKQYYLYNNRVKEIRIIFHELRKGNNPFLLKDNIIYSNKFRLQDKMVYQNIKLGSMYTAKYISFSLLNSYKGTKYNDTCISDIQFYYNGKRINISGIEESKKEYVKNIEKNLIDMLSGKVYKLSDKLGFVKFFKNGDVKYNDDIPNNYDKSFLGVTKWKVEKSKLYFKYKNKWVLANYYTYGIISQSKSLVIRSIGKKRFNIFCRPFKG